MKIQQEIAERHDIKVSMISEPNETTVVVMVLPLLSKTADEK